MPTLLLLLLTGSAESAADADGLLGEGTWACSSSGAAADADDEEALPNFLGLPGAMKCFFSGEFETWNVAQATVTFLPSLRPENRRHVTFHVSVVQTSARRL